MCDNESRTLVSAIESGALVCDNESRTLVCDNESRTLVSAIESRKGLQIGIAMQIGMRDETQCISCQTIFLKRDVGSCCLPILICILASMSSLIFSETACSTLHSRNARAYLQL